MQVINVTAVTKTKCTISFLCFSGDAGPHTEEPVDDTLRDVSALGNNPSGDSNTAGKDTVANYLYAVLCAWQCSMQKSIFPKKITNIQDMLINHCIVDEIDCMQYILSAEMVLTPDILTTLQKDTSDGDSSDDMVYIRTIQMTGEALENAKSSVNFTSLTSTSDPLQIGHLKVVMPNKDVVFVKIQDGTVSICLRSFPCFQRL